MEYKFNENTRVQVPAALHLCRLGYTYLDNITEYDSKTNILTDVFLRSVQRLNPALSELQARQLLNEITLILDNNDLGREFYNKLSSNSNIKLIDFQDADRNEWHVTTEFTCENQDSGDSFRPDITCFVNGLPLAFIEVKKPNNHDGILAERERINVRMSNEKFRRFLNVTQLMIFPIIRNMTMKTGFLFKVRSIVVPQGTKPSSMSFARQIRILRLNIHIRPYLTVWRNRYCNTGIVL